MNTLTALLKQLATGPRLTAEETTCVLNSWQPAVRGMLAADWINSLHAETALAAMSSHNAAWYIAKFDAHNPGWREQTHLAVQNQPAQPEKMVSRNLYEFQRNVHFSIDDRLQM